MTSLPSTSSLRYRPWRVVAARVGVGRINNNNINGMITNMHEYKHSSHKTNENSVSHGTDRTRKQYRVVERDRTSDAAAHLFSTRTGGQMDLRQAQRPPLFVVVYWMQQ